MTRGESPSPGRRAAPPRHARPETDADADAPTGRWALPDDPVQPAAAEITAPMAPLRPTPGPPLQRRSPRPPEPDRRGPRPGDLAGDLVTRPAMVPLLTPRGRDHERLDDAPADVPPVVPAAAPPAEWETTDILSRRAIADVPDDLDEPDSAEPDREPESQPHHHPHVDPHADPNTHSADDSTAQRESPALPWKLFGIISVRQCYWGVLVCMALILHVKLYTNSGFSWHFFTEAASLVVGNHPPGTPLPGGLDLYANYPQLQFGPLTLLVAVVLGPFVPNDGWMVVAWLMTFIGLGVLYLIEHLVRSLRPDLARTPRATLVTMLLGGASFVLSWEMLAVHFGHLDDVLALFLLTAAAVAVNYQNPLLAGLCVGLATDAKPWALACAALLLAIPTLRGRIRAGIVLMVVVGAAWLPFVLANPHTLSAAGAFTIPNVPASGLHALGVNTPGTPSWDRATQIGLGCLLGAIAVFRRRWEAVIALGIGARLALDPSVYTYYTAGFALGLLIWDLVGHRKPMPLLSMTAFVGLTMVLVLTKDNQLLGELRLWTILLVCAALLFAPGRDGQWPELSLPRVRSARFR